MADHAVHHDYHILKPSPWPLVGSCFALVLAIGAVTFMKGFVRDEASPLYFFFGQGHPWIMAVGFLGVLYTMLGWWTDVVKESRAGDHTPVVQIHLRYGMILFIASEVMFFVAWFWIFFEMALFHDHRLLEGWQNWPPPGVETFDPFHIPLLNTLILLLSGTTVTAAHHGIQTGDRKLAKWALLGTIVLGLCFTALQVVEYHEAVVESTIHYKGNLYGASFFMATGFHGAHVIIGTLFLIVCFIRLQAGQFTPEKHFGFEAAAWYWHFVDVVWLFLFTFLYVVYG